MEIVPAFQQNRNIDENLDDVRIKLKPFFRFTVHISTIRDKKYRILSFHTKTELRASESQKALVKRIVLWQFPLAHSPAHSPVHSGSLCLTLALTGSLLLSNFAYTVIARLAAPLPR